MKSLAVLLVIFCGDIFAQDPPLVTPEQCPFPRLDNPGFFCNDEVTAASSRLDQLLEEIHANNPRDECMITKVQCDVKSPYRSFTGYCNNIDTDPTLGGTMSNFVRAASAKYEDRKRAPRNKSADGITDLPNPRRISDTVNYKLPSAGNGSSKDHTHLFMVFGQWLGHDVVYTSLIPAQSQCKNCSTDDFDNCMPIYGNPNDTFSPFRTGCMQFTRSVDGNLVENGQRQQINQVSAYMDTSNVYGSDIDRANALRDTTGGRMKMQGSQPFDLLPQVVPTKASVGCSPLSTESCFNAGDDRNGENMGLASIHTLWVKEHNRIAKFFEDNTGWTHDEIYLETRRLINAMEQHIAYAEFLPVLLPESLMKTKGIWEEEEGIHSSYDNACDVRPFTEFATAAYRIGHSTIHYRLSYKNDSNENEHITMNNNWYNVQRLKEDLSDMPMRVLKGAIDQNMQRVDKFDLNALNIQRGRDHGIPGYNELRRKLKLTELTSWEDLKTLNILRADDEETIGHLQEVYTHIEDIDLITGITIENNSPAGTKYGLMREGVGAQLIAETFKKYKKCDRFFYSHTGAGQFTPNQLKEIRKIGLGNILCEHMSEDKSVGFENPFFNQKASCKHFLKIDLNFFIDPEYTGLCGNPGSKTQIKYEQYDKETDLIQDRSDVSLEYCERLCHQKSECVAFNWQEFTWDNAEDSVSPKHRCFLFKSTSTGIIKTSTRTKKEEWVFGTPDRTPRAVDPLAHPAREAEDWQDFSIPSDQQRCSMEVDGNSDFGAKFFRV